MDVLIIDNLAAVDSSTETTELIQRWKEIVKPGIYRMTGRKWKKYHELKFLRNERRVIEERLQQIIRGREQGILTQRFGPQHSGEFQPQTKRSEQWTVDPFWEIDQHRIDQHRPNTNTYLNRRQPHRAMNPLPPCQWRRVKSNQRPINTRQFSKFRPQLRGHFTWELKAYNTSKWDTPQKS